MTAPRQGRRTQLRMSRRVKGVDSRASRPVADWQIRRAAARLAVAGFLLFAVWMIHRRGPRVTAA